MMALVALLPAMKQHLPTWVTDSPSVLTNDYEKYIRDY